jgi:hypothetical protein
MGELGLRLDLDLLRKAGDHTVKQVDVLVGIVIGAGQEKVGDAANNFYLLLGRSSCEGAFNFGDKRPLFHHSVSRPGNVDGDYLYPSVITITLGENRAFLVTVFVRTTSDFAGESVESQLRRGKRVPSHGRGPRVGWWLRRNSWRAARVPRSTRSHTIAAASLLATR